MRRRCNRTNQHFLTIFLRFISGFRQLFRAKKQHFRQNFGRFCYIKVYSSWKKYRFLDFLRVLTVLYPGFAMLFPLYLDVFSQN